jgi:hypothetical protein
MGKRVSWKEIETKQKDTSKLQNLGTSEVMNIKTSELPKFRTFEIKLSILLRQDQLDFLESLAREIMSNREQGYKKERITKNSIIRTFIDILKEIDFDNDNISDEKELFERIKRQIK